MQRIAHQQGGVGAAQFYTLHGVVGFLHDDEAGGGHRVGYAQAGNFGVTGRKGGETAQGVDCNNLGCAARPRQARVAGVRRVDYRCQLQRVAHQQGGVGAVQFYALHGVVGLDYYNGARIGHTSVFGPAVDSCEAYLTGNEPTK